MPNKTPLQTSLGSYLSKDRGLRIDPVTVGNIAAYRAVEPVSSYRTMIAAGDSNLGASAAATLRQLKSDSLYPLLDTDPSDSTNKFTDIVESHINLILPSDLTIFTQVYGIAGAGIIQNNSLIESSSAINEKLGSTFTSMDDLVTGGFSQVSTDLPAFGSDLANAGNAINLAYLDRLGEPSLTVATIKKSAKGFSGFRSQMIAQGVKASVIDTISLTSGSPGLLAESQIYQAMKTVTDTDLQNILDILSCSVSVTSLDQLLDLKILLPNSFTTLLAPDAEGNSYNIYSGSGLNSVFSDLGVELGGTATTPELAGSAKALAKSLKQIKNISGKSTGAIAATVQSIEVSTDLPDINSLSQPIPTDAQIDIDALAQGSGADGTYVVADAIGSVAGYDFDPLLPLTVANIEYVSSEGFADILFSNSESVFPLITDVINGVYGSNPDIYGGLGNTLPSWITSSGNGYGTIDSACISLAPDAQTQINGVVSNLSASLAGTDVANAVQTANGYWSTLGNRIALEKTILTSTGVDFANLQGQAKSLSISWADGVASYALDTQTGGASEFITKIANIDDISGQTVVAALREQRTINSLQNLGTPPDSNNT